LLFFFLALGLTHKSSMLLLLPCSNFPKGPRRPEVSILFFFVCFFFQYSFQTSLSVSPFPDMKGNIFFSALSLALLFSCSCAADVAATRDKNVQVSLVANGPKIPFQIELL
jgi:hypothetical protein